MSDLIAFDLSASILISLYLSFYICVFYAVRVIVNSSDIVLCFHFFGLFCAHVKKGSTKQKRVSKDFFQFSQQGQGTKMRKNDWTDFSFQHRFSIDARKKTKQSLKTKLNKDVLVLNLSRHQHSKNAATSNSFLSEYFIFNSFSRTILCH